MFKQVFRLTFIALIWKQYKRVIVSTVVLFGYLWLVSSLHSDYLDYAQLQQDTNVGHSFLYKWAAFAAGVLIYLSYHLWFKKRSNGVQSKSPGEQITSTPADDENDPFAEIRKRKKLRSRAEMMMDEQADNNGE